MANRVPLRLLIHFQRSPTPLVQLTEGMALDDGVIIGAGTRALDVSNPARTVRLRDYKSGAPLDERVTVAHALAVLAALSYDEGA